MFIYVDDVQISSKSISSCFSSFVSLADILVFSIGPKEELVCSSALNSKSCVVWGVCVISWLIYVSSAGILNCGNDRNTATSSYEYTYRISAVLKLGASHSRNPINTIEPTEIRLLCLPRPRNLLRINAVMLLCSKECAIHLPNPRFL